MATIHQAANISNHSIRPAATQLAKTYFLYQQLLAMAAAEDWVGIFSQFSEKDPFLDPDRPNDERTPITPETIKAVISGMQDFVNFVDTSGLKSIILKTAVNPVGL